MYVIYIICSVLALFILVVFFIPLTLEISINKKGKRINFFNNNSMDSENNKIESYIVIRLIRVVPVFKINIDDIEKKILKKQSLNKKISEKKEDKNNNSGNIVVQNLLMLIVSDKDGKLEKIKKETKKYFDDIYVEKLGFSFGFNTEDYVKNAYINASLNSILCLYINYRRKNFNFNRLYYQVHISDYTYYLDLNCIINIKLADTIGIAIKTYFFVKKSCLN